MTLPPNYYVSYGGQFESEASASATLMWTSLCALMIILMLLYQEFRNIRQSLIILVNMPLAMIGAIFMLRLTSGEINIPAIIGFISLMGITTRNGMLLMNRYNRLRDEGYSPVDRGRHRLVRPPAANHHDGTHLGSGSDTARPQRRQTRQRDTVAYGCRHSRRSDYIDHFEHVCRPGDLPNHKQET